MRIELLCASFLLFCLSQVNGKPFYWGDHGYYTTKTPLLKKAFSKLDHWFKELIDAYPSSTWYYKEHIYGRTYWKDPEVIRAWIWSTDMAPLIHRYEERPRVTLNYDPFGPPGVTYAKRKWDWMEDNVMSVPDSEEVERIEARNKAKKEGRVYVEGETTAKTDKPEGRGRPRAIKRGARPRAIKRGEY
uniref:Uncharacterized protein n=1 Tax=Cacopsylla melanoneura TaxID=428564 RepID=A0A8D8T7H7_9HEMI